MSRTFYAGPNSLQAKSVLQHDIVRVRWLRLDAVGAPDIARWHGMLDAEEMARAARFRFAQDRASFIAAHALARAMLSEATGKQTATWQYRPGTFGKPAIVDEDAGGLNFNISHTRGGAACAIAYHDVGVDIEAADRQTGEDVAARFFSAEENALLLAAPAAGRKALFFAIWTLKEAFIKATGEGLQRPLESFSFAFDPLRISFHPERMGRLSEDDPASWQFAQFSAAPQLPLAVAIRRPAQKILRLNARAASHDEIMPA
jgi:4'-phosphopantetheinyl transferase